MTQSGALPDTFLAKGVNGQLIVTPTRVTIQRKGLLGMMMQQGDKDIRLDQISAVQIKKPGMTRGFIRISFLGGAEMKAPTAMNAANDENAILFKGSQYNSFVYAKYLIEQHQQAALAARSTPQAPVLMPSPVPPHPPAPHSSTADELEKLAALRDRGVLTEEEFAAKKRQILGL